MDDLTGRLTKRSATLFLQVILVLIGAVVLALMLWEPHLEGRNAHATVWQVYFDDPFLAYAYAGSIAFFVALWQGFKLLGYMRRDEVFSPASVKALRTIKRCAITLIAFLLGAELFFVVVQRTREDDIAGGVMMGLFLILVSVVVATAAAVFERTLQNAVEMKTEHDLTI